MIARQHQALDALTGACGIEPVGISHRYDLIAITMNEQHRAAKQRNASFGGDVVETMADYTLNMRHDIAADRRWYAASGEPAAHHVGRVGKG